MPTCLRLSSYREGPDPSVLGDSVKPTSKRAPVPSPGAFVHGRPVRPAGLPRLRCGKASERGSGPPAQVEEGLAVLVGALQGVRSRGKAFLGHLQSTGLLPVRAKPYSSQPAPGHLRPATPLHPQV